MDVLADAFAALRFGETIYPQSDPRPPWGMAFERSNNGGLPVIVRGRCWLRTAQRAPIELEAGDVVLLLRAPKAPPAVA